MSTNNPKFSKPTSSKSSSNQTQTPPTKPSPSSSTSLSSHLAMVELKQRILTYLSKLSDRDTHQIALDEFQSIITSLSPDSLPMLLNCLYDAASDPKPALKKESLRLLALVASSHPDPASAHLTKIIAHIARRLKDADSGVRDACRDSIGALANQYIGSDGEAVALFVRPLFEVMGEQNKAVQTGAAMCLARMVECAREPPVTAFQKLSPRICKYLVNPNFLAKAAVLSVLSNLSQVGAIAPQSLPALMQSIHGCLENSDWATRKAAAETLSVIASHSSELVADGAVSTITALEACRFDKVKPVRDSMTEALQQWKKFAGKGDGASDNQKASSNDGKDSETAESVEKPDLKKSNVSDRRLESSGKDVSNSSSPTSHSLSKVKGSSISDKTVGILKKKAPALTDKELNPDFFQKLETRGSGDWPVEVVVARRSLHSSHSQGDEESEPNDIDARGASRPPFGESNDIHGSLNEKRADVYTNTLQDVDEYTRDRWMEQRVFRSKDLKARALDVDDRTDINQRDPSSVRGGLSRTDGNSEAHKGNWLAIQRQLSQLERQQANLMAMLQDFMGGSHDSMLTLENRVRGLERIVEDMARDLAISSGRRGTNLMMGYEGSSNRNLSKYNGLPDYSSSKLGRGGDGRISFAERFPLDGIGSGLRGRDPSWRADASDVWDSYSYGARNGHTSSRRAISGASSDGRLPRTELDGDQVGNRRAWEKGPGPRLGEGPSARSVWQASKDEATLEAIRVAGEDNGTSRTTTRVAIPELDAEALTDDNPQQEKGPLWASWSHAMDSLHVGDMDSAYAEVLSTGDDLLLVKLMDRSGPVVDQLSYEIASEVLHAVGQLLLDQRSIDIGLSWIQQLTDLVMENGPDIIGIPPEVKRELLLSLHEASGMDQPEDWEGMTPDQMMLQFASAWGIDLQELEK